MPTPFRFEKFNEADVREEVIAPLLRQLGYASGNHDVRDWHTYLKLRKNAQNPTVLHLTNGARGDFYTPDGINVWAPFDHSQQNNVDCNPK